MTTKTRPIIQLVYSAKDEQVIVETERQDRFVLTVSAAIEACRAFGRTQEFNEQFKEMQTRLTAWIRQHEADISEAYLTVRDSAILLLIVQKSQAFHQELEDSLTELDIDIAQDDALNLIRLSVLALPKASEASIQSFLVSGGASR